MKKILSKLEWILWLIILMPVVLLGWIWDKIPSKIPTHYNLNGEIDAWDDKSILLWLVPTILLSSYLVLTFIPLIDPKRRVESMGNKFLIVRIIWLLLVSSVMLIWIYTSAYPNWSFVEILFPLMGIFLILIGNYLQSIKPNYFIGIRTPWSLQSKKNWLQTHRLGGRVYMVGGALLVLVSFEEKSKVFNLFFFLSLLIILLIPIFYSFLIYIKSSKTTN